MSNERIPHPESISAGAHLELMKIGGEMHPADVFTRHLPSEEKIKGSVKLLDLRFLQLTEQIMKSTEVGIDQ